jgi:hypothetical protein
MTALTMFAVFYIQENANEQANIVKQAPSLVRAFKRPEILSALALILCYRVVEAPAMAMLNPMLIDQNGRLPKLGC